MPRLIRGGIIYMAATLCSVSLFANDYLVDIDIKDALHDRQLDVKDLGDPETMVKGAVKGDIYNNSYARAELNIAKPSSEALDAAYSHIADRCGGKLSAEDITTVFAQTAEGKELFAYLKARDVVEDIAESDNYGASCERVVACYFDVPLNYNIGYTVETRKMCDSIVTDTFLMMQVRTERIQRLPDINYGDELLANAKADDGPFDLLKDIETIGTILFSHNDPASEIHFFRVQEPQTYVDNDPDLTTPYTVEQPNWDEEDNRRRFEPTRGLDPQFPKSIYDDDADPQPDATYVPPEIPTDDTSLYTDPAPIGGSAADIQANANSIGAVGEVAVAGTLHNAICEDPAPEEEEENLLELGEIEQEQTYTYNKKLDLDVRISLALAATLSPEIEEQYGIDPVQILENTPVSPRDLPNIFSEENLDGATLEDIEQGMKECLQQFTDLADTDPNTLKKAVRKNITQPTAFTSCIMSKLCFEIGDASGRGLFRIQGCTIPSRRGYSVADNQPVMSIEEIIDEFANVCIGLEESGQLLEHNKTKDAWDHKLMRVKFGDKFSFSLSVGFKPLKDKKDPAHEKRMQIANNDYLMNNVLEINDNLTHVEQRNKYIRFSDPHAAEKLNGIDGKEEQAVKDATYIAAQQQGEEIVNKEQYSQLRIHGTTLDTIGEFVDTNTNYRMGLNDITHSIAQQRQNEAEEARRAQ